MFLAKVIGNVWSTKKDKSLEGLSFLLVQPLGPGGKPRDEMMAVVDPLGAGEGEMVLVAFGKAARNVIGRGDGIAYQTAVIGIVDEVQWGGHT